MFSQAGHLLINNVRYYIEPLLDHEQNELGHHAHVIYTRDAVTQGRYDNSCCGTKERWARFYMDNDRERECFQRVNVGKQCDDFRPEYNIQTLATVDKKFLDFHRNYDYQIYVLTVLNMVFDLFQDSSVAVSINIVLVRIIYLDQEVNDLDLEVTRNAEVTLQNFCQWQYKMNPRDWFNPIHHDIAILMTRSAVITF